MIDKKKAIQYLKLAQQFAKIFSKDPSTQVGAILLAPNSYQILSMGFNGMPRGIKESSPKRWLRPLKYKLVEHAERNALYNACRHGAALEGSIAVITLFPCYDCARGLIQSGIRTVVTCETNERKFRWKENWTVAKLLLEEAGIDIILLTEEEINKETSVQISIPEYLADTTHQNTVA